MSDPGFGIYVHWPFCAAKCPYCDFNSYVAGGVDHAAWSTALVTELEYNATLKSKGPASSIFFGGGTPSLMDPKTVGDIIETAHRLWGLTNDCEITLEANPTSVEADKFKAFAAAGVGRVSIGVQALNDPDLKALGRMHSVKEALAAYDLARNTFGRVSFDLIYARPGQSLAQWEAELGSALELAADHLSMYQLTLEPGTPFYDLNKRGNLILPDEDISADMYELTQEMTRAAGLYPYEVSNHARPGAESLHNLTYWRLGDYVGVGPGAHGRLTLEGRRVATETILGPDDWLKAAQAAGHGMTTKTALSPMDSGEEYLLMCLRLEEGASLTRFEALAGQAFDVSRVAPMAEDGLAIIEGDVLRVTDKGRPVLNAVIAALVV